MTTEREEFFTLIEQLTEAHKRSILAHQEYMKIKEKLQLVIHMKFPIITPKTVTEKEG